MTYLLKSGYNQLNILYHRQPLDEVLKDPTLPFEIRNKLLLAQRVRFFAENSLKLRVGTNYSTYVQLKKPYVVWAVNASPKWKLEHHLWYFPIVGSVPYKGFPDENDANEEAKELQNEGYDTYVRGVSAYSTLGWFSDPILSSMMRYSEEDLVNTLIHESVHATLFIKGNADFNERLASFIGDKGTEEFYSKEEGPQSSHLENIRNENEDQKIFSAFISDELKLLQAFYKANPSVDLSLRESKFLEMKQRFQQLVRPKLKGRSPLAFDKLQLNNARLLLFKTYVEDLSDFERLYKNLNSNLVAFIEKTKNLESSSNPVEALKKL